MKTLQPNRWWLNKGLKAALRAAIVLSTTLLATAQAHGPGSEQIDRITALISSEGESPHMYAERARVYQDNQHYREALADYERAAQLDPDHAGYDLDRARVFYATGEYLSALDYVDLFLVREMPTVESLLLKARVHRKLKQSSEAIDAYRMALEDVRSVDERPLPEWYIEYSDTLAAAGAHKEAVHVLQAGIGILGPLSVFQLRAAELEVGLGDFDAALRRIDSVMQQSQRKDVWLSRRGDILLAAGRDAEARQTYRQALDALQRLPLRLRNLPVSTELASAL
jgi:tetratricopeptide (TPR) repeat protein